MKKLLIILAICFLAGTKVQAQKDVLVLPDSLGRYMYELLVNHAPLNQTEIKVARLKPGYLSPQSSWNKLQKCLLLEDIGLDHVKYSKSEFYYTQTEYNDKLEKGEYKLYVQFSHKSDRYKFKFEAVRDSNQWNVYAVESYLLKWNGSKYKPIIDSQELEDKLVAQVVQWNEAFVPTVSLAHEKYIASPFVFQDRIYNIIRGEKIRKKDKLFFTKEQYNRTMVAKIRSDLSTSILSDTDIHPKYLKKAKEQYDNPFMVYQSDAYPMLSSLSKKVEKNFGVEDITKFRYVEQFIELGNFDRIDDTLDLKLTWRCKYDAGDAYLFFWSSFCDGEWKINLSPENYIYTEEE